ncbi:MAG TPA: helix-turn-helix transcriptional regulator, partial [Thermoleophilaceae bacterium]|nr:helix-turn-helix transcriptional regulator [Thermoleophilaceae bacterium]
DFLSARQFHRLELYDEIYRKLGAEDQIAFGLPGDVVVGVAFNRPRRDFTARDRAVLETIRPHMASAFGEARARERATALIAALMSGVQRAGGTVVVLDRANGVQHADEPARHLLEAYAGPGMPPAPVAEWLAGAPGSAPLELAGPNGVLSVSHHRTGDTGALLLEEHRAGPDPAELRALGLTRREAEVLELVAIGRTNQEIADAMVITPGTVRKHLERIYAKLGVHTRTEAAARAHSRPPHGIA